MFLRKKIISRYFSNFYHCFITKIIKYTEISHNFASAHQVVRLRNQLNISQHTISPIIQRSTVTANQVNGSVQPSDSSREEATSTRVPLGAASQAATSPSEPRNIFYKRKQLTNNKLSNMESTKEEDSDEASKSTDAVKLQKEDEMLRASLGTLHDENEKLREHVTTLVNTIRNSDEGEIYNIIEL